MKKNSLEDYVISIPDFPEPGVLFRDVTSIFNDEDGFQMAIDGLQEFLNGVEYDTLAGLESRGFCLASALAYKNHKKLLLVRKGGKLPRETVSETYNLEYGTATMEIHKEDVTPGERVVVVDDLLATGGTLNCAFRLIERLGGIVVKGILLMELEGLEGRKNIGDRYTVDTIIKYEGK